MTEGGDRPDVTEIIDLNVRMAELGISIEPPEQMRQRLDRQRLQLEHQLEQEAIIAGIVGYFSRLL